MYDVCIIIIVLYRFLWDLAYCENLICCRFGLHKYTSGFLFFFCSDSSALCFALFCSASVDMLSLYLGGFSEFFIVSIITFGEHKVSKPPVWLQCIIQFISKGFNNVFFFYCLIFSVGTLCVSVLHWIYVLLSKPLPDSDRNLYWHPNSFCN